MKTIEFLIQQVNKINPVQLCYDMIANDNGIQYITKNNNIKSQSIDEVQYIYKSLHDHLKAKTKDSYKLMESVFTLFDKTLSCIALNDRLNSMN